MGVNCTYKGQPLETREINVLIDSRPIRLLERLSIPYEQF
jgi:hypothetical protein